ncbi:hypothetical protein LLEC1_02391, partial [Akanthomyces lecanii]
MVNESPILIISCGPDPSRYLINDEWASLTQEVAARTEVVWARLDWAFAGYEVHTGGRLNPHAGVIADGHLAAQLVSLPSTCELSQLTVRVGSADDVLYEIYSDRYERARIESGIVMARVGDGYVALVGDRENEASTRATIVSMLKL